MTRKRAIFHGRLRRPEHGDAADEVVEIDPAELTGLFAAPGWMRDLGFSAWLLVGMGVALIGAIWLLALTETIVMPLIAAGIVAAVTGPAVDWLARRGVPRGLGATVVFLAILAVGLGICLLILVGIASQADELSAKLAAAANEIESWARGLGAESGAAASAKEGADASVSQAFKALTGGLLGGIDALASLAVFLSFTALGLFFMLKDMPTISAFAARHLGPPEPLARTILDRVASSLRGYFLGVTAVAVWSALVVGGGGLLIGVPLVGTIAVVTFVGGYIPYLGAWAAGAFAVLIALGGDGAAAAAAMTVVVLLANGVLQQLVQPIAYGAALKLHPLAVLVATIAGGCLFGTVGLVLAAPLLSAAVRITDDLRRAEHAAESSPAAPEPEPAR